ncbi:serine/threonine-protein kinase [Streptomyces termitum]
MRRGEVLAGRYRLEERLGAGGFGVVWRARDPRIQRDVAVKTMVPGSPGEGLRMVREARLSGGLRHPYIATVYDFGETEHAGRRTFYLVMELVDGAPLADVLQEGTPPLETALTWAEQICEGLAVAHDAGIVHRDVKPANVMITRSGEVRILDFGLARRQVERPDAPRVTTEGAIVGSLPYMAPERWTGQSVDGRADLYALGCVLMELCAGRLPFPEGEWQELWVRHTTAEPPVPSALRPGLPAALDALVAELLAKDPGDRPGDAREVARRLRAMRSAAVTRTVTGPPPARPRTPAPVPPPGPAPAAPPAGPAPAAPAPEDATGPGPQAAPAVPTAPVPTAPAPAGPVPAVRSRRKALAPVAAAAVVSVLALAVWRLAPLGLTDQDGAAGRPGGTASRTGTVAPDTGTPASVEPSTESPDPATEPAPTTPPATTPASEPPVSAQPPDPSASEDPDGGTDTTTPPPPLAQRPAVPREGEFVDVATGLCLDSDAYGRVYTLDCNDGEHQRWRVVARGGGEYALEDVATSRCLDSNADQEVYTLPCNDGSYQEWYLRRSDGAYRFENKATGFFLDSNAYGEVYTHVSNTGDYQRWR